MNHYQNLPRLTFRQLEVLRAVYREKSYSNAALDLRSTRGNVKRTCLELESMLGGALFNELDSSNVLPTPFAETMISLLSPLIRSVRKLEDTVEIMHETGRVLRIGASPELFASDWFTGFLRSFRHHCPFRVCCLMIDDKRFQTALLNAECDVYLSSSTISTDKLEEVPLGEIQHHTAYLRRNHPYSELKPLLASTAHGI